MNTSASIDSSERLEQLLCNWAVKQPDAPAIQDESGVITYESTLRHATIISDALLAAKAQQENFAQPTLITGLSIQRSSTAIIALLGALLAGYCYVPLPLAAGAKRLQSMIQSAQIQIVLVDDESFQALSDESHERDIGSRLRPILLNVQTLLASQASHMISSNRDVMTKNQIAYTLFSSGTTGKPKGIQMSHSAVLHYLDACRHTFKADTSDRWLHSAPYTFDVSVEEVFVPLSVGACIVCQPPQGLDSLTGYLDFLHTSRISAISMPTALWHRLSAHLVGGEDKLPETLRLVVIGGEAARSEAYQQWLSVASSHVTLVNAYGPTECCVSATFGTKFDLSGKTLSIGQPVPGMRAYVVERESNVLVSDGQIGRLLLSGPQLAVGYLGDEALTASKFFTNPFEPLRTTAYDRVYDTGDLVYKTPTGELNFCGRVDLQLQVRGQRVEAEGVESVLSGSQSLAEAAIIVVEEQGTEAMVAFLVMRAGYTEMTSLREIEERCADHLVTYEKPSHFIFIDALPLTTNGKIDKKALNVKWALCKNRETSKLVSSLKTETEKTLLELWKEALYLEDSVQIGRDCTLAELGGHSLTLVSLTSRIYGRFKLRVSVSELARHETLKAMAAFLDELPSFLDTELELSHVTEDDSHHDRLFDLTTAQEQLYLAQSKEPNSPFFNDGVAIEIQGEYSPQLIEDSVHKVIRRHPALRCVLVKTGSDDKVRQRLLPLNESLWGSIWHRQAVPPCNLERISADIFGVPLDLFNGPLVKVHFLESTSTKAVLIVQAHHICWDGFSDGIFIEEFTKFYQEPQTILENPTPPWAIKTQSRPDIKDNSNREFSEYLQNIPETIDLPTDFSPPLKKSYSRGGVVRSHWDATLVRQAVSTAGRNITPTSLALSVFAAVLRRFAGGQSDFALGMPTANRLTPEAAASIGFFVNMLPLRVQAEDEHSLLDVINMIESGLKTLLRNQDVVLGDVYRPQLGSSSTHDRLLKFCFSFQDAPHGTLSDQCSFKRWPLHNGAARADLTCFTELCADGSIDVELEYDMDLFESGTIASIANSMTHVLQSAALHNFWKSPLGQLSLGCGELKEEDLPTDYAWDKAHENLGLYLLQAVETCPQNIAIVDESSGIHITYEELAQRAKFLAQKLNSCAKGTGVVLLLLQRSWQVPVSQIACALLGRPWACCDVSQPQERIMKIITEAKPCCIITQHNLVEELTISDLENPLMYPESLFDGTWDTSCKLSTSSKETDLAYIIYTSGTTGVPKGVAIEKHSLMSFLEHIKTWITGPGAPTSLNSILTSNTAFDGSLSQMYSALITGGKLVLAKQNGEQDGEYIVATMHKYAINYLCTTATAARLWMTQAAQFHSHFLGSQFRYLLLGGDELTPKFVSEIFSRSQNPTQVEIKNVYGPTEGTIFSSYGTYRVSDIDWLEGRRRSPINTILPSAAVSIIGPNMQDLPVGAVGEIVIWGPCLAKEYIGLPELNATKFITRNNHILRGWRTGDLGRKILSSAFEVLGRTDTMRKVLGGFRVDLDEVRVAIVGHNVIRECYVSTVEEDRDGTKENKIVAHVALHSSKHDSQREGDLETVANWETMFTGVNQSLEEYNEDIDLSLDYRGWASSFDRATIPKQHMEEWVDCTIERILNLDCFRNGQKPRVAEIGCGTGMILFKLVDKVSSYYATDLVAPTVAQVQGHAQKLGYNHVKATALPAHCFDEILEQEEQFDLIICNSVAQYFPSSSYLNDVVHRARSRLAPLGSLFMGDIRHDGLKMQHAAMSAYCQGAKTVSELQHSTVEISEKDKELQIDPSFFVDKCGSSGRLFQGEALVELRRGLAPTEMTLFRYDVVLKTEETIIKPARIYSSQWQDHNIIGSSSLPSTRPGAAFDVVVYENVPNKRLLTSERLRRLVDPVSNKHQANSPISALLRCLEAQSALDPETAMSLVQTEGYLGMILPSPQSATCFDLVITSSSFEVPARHWAFKRLSTTTQRVNTQQNLCKRVPISNIDRGSIFLHLFHKLPRYMIPHYLIAVKELPLAGTGKVNTRLLHQPRPDDLLSGAPTRKESGNSIKNSISSEIAPLAQTIATIFAELLGQPTNEFSIHDDFFFSGGHSIMAAKAIQMIRKRVNIVVPFTAILAHPTPAALAIRLTEIERFKHQASDLHPLMTLLRPAESVVPQTDIVVLHPIGGGLLPMAGLVDAISARLKQVRIVGIPWSPGEEKSNVTVDDLAQKYADIVSDFYKQREMSALRSHELLLLGWSFGGTVAYEISKRLQIAGLSIKLLLLDSPTLEAAVRDIKPHMLAAENYAEHIIEYVAQRGTSTNKGRRLQIENMGSNGDRKQRSSQDLGEAFIAHQVNENTDLIQLPPIVRQVIDVPTWVTDIDLVEASRGLQSNLQALCNSLKQERRESLIIPSDTKVRIVQVQASHGLCNKLTDRDLGWQAELDHQAGKVDWVNHVVTSGHDDMLSSVIDPIAELVVKEVKSSRTTTPYQY